MKTKTLFTINAWVAAIFGLAFFLIPGQVIPLFGPAVNGPLKSLGQLYGAALVMIAVLTWAVRNSPDSEARRAVILALLVGDSAGFLAALIAQLSGVFNSLGWLSVAIYLVLALSYAYVNFQPAPAPEFTRS